MACNDCPELNPNPNEGCLSPSTSSCITYDGEDITCADIASGQTLNQVIEQLADNDCDLQEQIDDLSDTIEELSGNQYVFSCEDLNTCQLDNLGDVTTTTPSTGQYLTWSGTQWVNTTLVFPDPVDPFSCGDLASCSIADLGNVTLTAPGNGQVLTFQSGQWINATPAVAPVYTSNNGITKTSNNFQLGGTLIQNTILSGANFNLLLGEDSSKLNHLYGRATTLDLAADIISLNTTAETSQTEGLRYLKSNGNLSLGKDVFGGIGTYTGNYRIGNDITLAKTGLLDPAGFYIGSQIDIDSSVCYAIGSDMQLANFVGVAIGINNSVAGYAGGFIMGSEIDVMGGTSGNQSGYLFGAKIDIEYATGIAQGSLVFNPTSTAIKSSPTGNASTEKIRVDQTNGFVATFNVNDYYFFTNVSNNAGWNTNTDVVRINRSFIQISQSTGSVAEQKEACIRYNTSLNKLQVYTGAAWETVTSV